MLALLNLIGLWIDDAKEWLTNHGLIRYVEALCCLIGAIFFLFSIYALYIGLGLLMY